MDTGFEFDARLHSLERLEEGFFLAPLPLPGDGGQSPQANNLARKWCGMNAKALRDETVCARSEPLLDAQYTRRPSAGHTTHQEPPTLRRVLSVPLKKQTSSCGQTSCIRVLGSRLTCRSRGTRQYDESGQPPKVAECLLACPVPSWCACCRTEARVPRGGWGGGVCGH